MGTIGTRSAQNCIFRIFRSDFNREMADIEGQSDSAGPLPHWLPWVCRILACFGGLWILSGFLRVFLGIFAMLVDGSILCVCFKEVPIYKTIMEKLEPINYLHKAIIYFVVPLVCLLIVVPDYSASHLVDSFVMWAAAGFAGYAAYLLHKNGDGPRLVISI